MLARGRHYFTMGWLRRAAPANSNNSGRGKYDSIISGSTHEFFITVGQRRGKEMTYQHGKDIFLVFLLEEDEDV